MSIHEAGLGATRRPSWIASLLASDRVVRAVISLVVIAVVSTALVSGWVVSVAFGIPLLALAPGLVGLSGLTVVADGIARIRWHPHDHSGPVLATSPTGMPATAWLRSRAALVRPICLVASMLVLTVGEAVAATLGGYGWGFVAPIALLAFGLWLGRPLLLGRARAGGLYLTADGMEHLFGTDRVEVAWADVTLWSHAGSLGLVDRGGVRRDAGGWRMWDITDRMARREDVPIPTAFLTGRGPVIAESVEGILADPEGSPTPGTLGSVGRLRELAALRRVRFDS